MTEAFGPTGLAAICSLAFFLLGVSVGARVKRSDLRRLERSQRPSTEA